MNTVVRAIIFIIILAAIVGGIVYVYTPMTDMAAPPAAVEAPATPPAAVEAPASPPAEPAPAPAEPTPPPAETPPAPSP